MVKFINCVFHPLSDGQHRQERRNWSGQQTQTLHIHKEGNPAVVCRRHVNDALSNGEGSVVQRVWQFSTVSRECAVTQTLLQRIHKA